MSSFLKVYKAALENKIKPILGCELYLNDEFFNNKEEFLKSKKKDKEENEEPETDAYDELIKYKDFRYGSIYVHVMSLHRIL